MIDPRCRLRLTALALAALLGACSSPNPSLYTIAPVTGAEQNRAPKVIELQQISLAHYLERSQIVRSSENYRLEIMNNDWWGEPLGAMLSRVLIQELGQRMPHSVAIGEGGAVSVTPDATVALDVQRLDADSSGQLILQAQASVAFKGRQTPALQAFRFSIPQSAPGVAGEVAAISVAVGELADGLTVMLTAGPPGK